MIVQGGGPTAVLNVTLAEIVAESRKEPAIGRVLGARGGTRGVVDGDIVDLSAIAADDLERLRSTPGAALGSSRFSPSDEQMDALAATVKKFDVGYMVFMGGNGTMHGAQRVSAHLAECGLDVVVVGAPKTIDNDLAETDRCPGFASAARYIATTARELGADLRSLPQPVTILETMGRNVGWLAAASALGRAHEGDAPQLVYLPEVPFEMDVFLDDVDATVQEHGWAVVAIAEGAAYADGTLVYSLADPAQTDALKRPMVGGVAQHLATIVSARLKMRCRNERPGLIGRASMALSSAQDRADAALVGSAVVEAAVAGKRDNMVALEPLGSEGPGYRLVPFLNIAGKERTVPREWAVSGPAAMPAGLRAYLQPLVGPLGEHFVEFPKADPREDA